MADIYFFQRWRGSAFKMLFFRALCDFGLGLRFILIPAFNQYLCGSRVCDRGNSDESRCPFPSAFLEYFLLTSECWFLCSGMDLVLSATNPFSSFEPRLKYYHLFSWLVPLIIVGFPFFIDQYEAVYGFFYVAYNLDDQAFCWLKIQSENVLGPPMTIFFFVPLNVIYVVNLLALLLAFNRLRKGLNRSFLPRLKMLVSSSITVLVLILYWLLFFVTYGWAFYNRRNTTYEGGLVSVLTCLMASKGFSCLITWILTTNSLNLKNLDGDEEKLEENVALREEARQP